MVRQVDYFGVTDEDEESGESLVWDCLWVLE
jgi:hypothetical protein